jgi:hypothetical protein
MLNRVVTHLANLVWRPTSSATSEAEARALTTLRGDFRDLEVAPVDVNEPAAVAWATNMAELRTLVVSDDPRRFLRWRVIWRTMFIVFASFTRTELNALKRRSDWRRWRSAIAEDPIGSPIPYVFYPSSSANLIHHATHLAEFETTTGGQIQDHQLIVEFGGGYGSLCRLCYRLGFAGRYVIYDLPAFSALQRYFLSSLGLPVRSGRESSLPAAGIFCVSDLPTLRRVIGDAPDASLFVATWSLSEAPVSVRDAMLKLVAGFRSFLIAYQDRFTNIENGSFFDTWHRGHPEHRWTKWEMRHMSGNHYLIGYRGAEGNLSEAQSSR